MYNYNRKSVTPVTARGPQGRPRVRTRKKRPQGAHKIRLIAWPQFRASACRRRSAKRDQVTPGLSVHNALFMACTARLRELRFALSVTMLGQRRNPGARGRCRPVRVGRDSEVARSRPACRSRRRPSPAPSLIPVAASVTFTNINTTLYSFSLLLSQVALQMFPSLSRQFVLFHPFVSGSFARAQ